MRHLAFALAILVAPSALAQNMASEPKSVSCVSLRSIDSTSVKDSKTIIFKMRGNKYYKNELPHSCPGLGFERAFSIKSSTSELCNVDIIRVLENYGGTLREGAGCGLGKFVEYTPPPRMPKADKPKS